MRRTPDHTSLSWMLTGDGTPVTRPPERQPGLKVAQLPARPPANAVSILVYMTSRPISRLVTGFQIVREPICQAFQSEQPGPKPNGPQIILLTASLSAS